MIRVWLGVSAVWALLPAPVKLFPELHIGWTGKPVALISDIWQVEQVPGCDATPRHLEVRSSAGNVLSRSAEQAVCLPGPDSPDMDGNGLVNGGDLAGVLAAYELGAGMDLTGDDRTSGKDALVWFRLFEGGAEVVR